jgi:hypothetical protein
LAQRLVDESGRSTVVLTFLIADVRGYTRFTRERGDAAAAILAKRFADLARDAVEARGGRVIELRGDETLAVFDSPQQAVLAALEFQATCVAFHLDPARWGGIRHIWPRSGVAAARAGRVPSNTGGGMIGMGSSLYDRPGSKDSIEAGPASEWA